MTRIEIVMFLRCVAASILVTWFGLAGIVLGEVTGLFEEPPDAEGSVETALAKIANCIRRSKVDKAPLIRLFLSIPADFSFSGRALLISGPAIVQRTTPASKAPRSTARAY